MQQAIALAEQAGAAGEVPVGAVVVGPGQQLLARAENRRQRDHDPTAHAEILALRQAGQQLGSWHLLECALYVTLEPCVMCAGALVLARLGLLVYGADDPKAGCVRSADNLLNKPFLNHHPQVIAGIQATTCQKLLKDWFQSRRSPTH